MASGEDVLLRLVIKGMDPAEVTRLAQQTYGQLKTEAARHIDALAALHRQKSQEMTDDTKKKVDEQIKAEQKVLQSTQQIMRAQEVAANQAHSAWSRTMEDLENVTVVATGAWRVMSEGFEIFHRLGEEIIRTTQIYNAQVGSIEEMRIATEGEVANIDLIAAKNRGVQKDLQLTDQQYGLVAASAKRYADAIGIDTKEALDKLIDGLAVGSEKVLKKAGVMVDATKANEDWAKAMDVTVESMTNEQKLTALQTQALEKMNEKMAEAGDYSDKLANRMERGWARLKTVVTDTLATIGNIDLSALTDPTAGLSNDMYKNLPQVQAQQKKQAEAFMAKMQADYEAQQAAFEEANSGGQGSVGLAGSAQFASDEEKKARASMKYKKPEKGGYYPFGVSGDEDRFDSPSRGEHTDTSRELDAIQKQYDEYVKVQSEMEDVRQKNLKEANEADEKRAVMVAKINTLYLDQKGVSVDLSVAYQKEADALGVNVEQLTHQQKMEAIANETHVQTVELIDKVEKAATKAADELRAQLKETENKGGFLSVLIFGVDGPEQTYKQMDEMMQRTVDTFGAMSGMLHNSAESMSGALAKAIGGALTHQAGWKTILHNQTHDILESLATQAGARAIFEAASALAFLAVGNFPSAASAGASAAMFGTLAAGAGLAAHAIGTVNTGPTQEQKWTQQYQTQQAKSSYLDSHGMGSSAGGSSGSFGSGGQKYSSPGGDTPQQIVFNFNSSMLDKESAGRAITEALRTLEQKTGQTLLASAA